MKPPSGGLLAWAVGGSVVAVSTAAILIRLAEAPPLVIAFHRLLYATLLLAPVAWWGARDELRSLSPRDLLGLAGVGAVLAVHFASWISSLDLTSVASSVVLVTLHPVFVGLVSWRLFDEGLTPRGWAGVALALAGGVVITARDAQRGPNPLLGDMLALVGALAAAVYFLSGRGYRRRLGLLAYVTPVYASCTVCLLALLLVLPAPWGGAVGGYAAREHLLFLALAVVPMILGHTVLNWALRHVTAPVVATAILGEPVASTLLALLVLQEAPPPGTLAGGVLVLLGIGLVAFTSARGARRTPAPPPPG